MTHLISAEHLLASYADYTVLDVQFTLGGPDSVSEYAAAHLPGARHLRIDGDLSGPAGPGGRHPLPDRAVLQEALRRCGIRETSAVVLYDGRTSQAAARAWWLLRHYGVDRVAVLDGGLAAWQQAGGPVETGHGETGPQAPAYGDIVLGDPHPDDTVDIDQAAALAADGRLWDVRAAERFRGETEPIDPKAGHIPGARNAPMSDFLAPDGRFKPAAEIRAYAENLGIAAGDATSCGSGITAAQAALALAESGIEVRVFPGSWSQWCWEDRPVESVFPRAADR